MEPLQPSRSLDAEPAAIADLVRATMAEATARGVAATDVVFAPGRVNLIGEHTDYSGGFVLPMTLPRGTVIAARLRTDDQLRFIGLAVDDEFQCVASDALRPEVLASAPAFAKYALGGFGAGVAADLVIGSSLPLASGLSSSASFLCALLRTRAALTQTTFVPWEAAREAQRVENEIVGLASGILDPAAVCISTFDSALLLDCRSLETKSIKIPAALAVLVSDSRAPRTLADSAYNDRAEACVRIASTLGVASLRDVTAEMLAAEATRSLPRLSQVDQRRARHVVTENARVHAFAAAMQTGDGIRAGELLLDSHASLRDDYEVSSPALDALVDVMMATPGVLGARLCGAGFGGSCVALVDASAAEAAAAAVDAKWLAAGNESARSLIATPAGGVRVVDV